MSNEAKKITKAAYDQMKLIVESLKKLRDDGLTLDQVIESYELALEACKDWGEA